MNNEKIQLTEECQKYLDDHSAEIDKKYKYCVQILSEQRVIHAKLVKKLVGQDLYELRISITNEHRIILFTVDHKNLIEANNIVLLYGFIKKSTKDYKKAIEQAEKLIRKYLVMNKLINANELLDQEFGIEGSASRDKFKEEAYTFYLSEILKSRRKELRLTQKELADRIGKQRPYISRVESGEDLRLSNFIQIATALGLNFNLTVN